MQSASEMAAASSNTSRASQPFQSFQSLRALHAAACGGEGGRLGIELAAEVRRDDGGYVQHARAQQARRLGVRKTGLREVVRAVGGEVKREPVARQERERGGRDPGQQRREESPVERVVACGYVRLRAVKRPSSTSSHAVTYGSSHPVTCGRVPVELVGGSAGIGERGGGGQDGTLAQQLSAGLARGETAGLRRHRARRGDGLLDRLMGWGSRAATWGRGHVRRHGVRRGHVRLHGGHARLHGATGWIVLGREFAWRLDFGGHM